MISLQGIPQQNVSRETKSKRSQATCKPRKKFSQKIQADRKGRRAEKISRILLRLKGYRILAARYKTPVGEIDIIAKRGKMLAIVEVKARSTQALALESLKPAQQQRIQRALIWFLARNPKFANLQVRFDIILILPFKWSHLQNIWFVQNGD